MKVDGVVGGVALRCYLNLADSLVVRKRENCQYLLIHGALGALESVGGCVECESSYPLVFVAVDRDVL